MPTLPGPVIAWALAVTPARIRDWKRRGLIGPTCCTRTRREGFDLADVARVWRSINPRSPRVVLDAERLKAHAERIRLRSLP